MSFAKEIKSYQEEFGARVFEWIKENIDKLYSEKMIKAQVILLTPWDYKFLNEYSPPIIIDGEIKTIFGVRIYKIDYLDESRVY
jgi:hypothetical protein